MKINNCINYRNNYSSIAFKHKIILDIGASNPNASCKVRVTTDDGATDIYTEKGQLSTNGFSSSEDFKEKLINKIKEIHKIAVERCQSGEYKPDEELLTDIVVFIPGTTIGDKIAFTPNLKDKNNGKEGKSLKNIEFSDFKNDLINKSSEETGITINKDDFEFKITKDLGGAGIGIAQKLDERNELHEGDYIIGLMSGGGFGSVDIKVKNKNVEIETSESSSDIIPDPRKHIAEKLGRCGASVKSHITNFVEYAGLAKTDTDSSTKIEQLLLEAGDSRVVVDNEIHVNSSNEDLIAKFDSDKRFKRLSSNDRETVFKIDASEELEETMRKARIETINEYASTVAFFAINKINYCANKLIIVGPFAHGLDSYIKEHPTEFEDKKATNLSELIYGNITQNIQDLTIESTGNLLDLYGFQVICDSTINFRDNTYAGYAMSDNHVTFVENRGSWFSIPLKTLKDIPVAT